MAGNIFQFVYHQDAPKYEAAGWEYAGCDDGVTARYRWAGKGRPVWPEYDDEMAAREVADFDAIWPEGGQ